jgi:hypothetical protein
MTVVPVELVLLEQALAQEEPCQLDHDTLQKRTGEPFSKPCTHVHVDIDAPIPYDITPLGRAQCSLWRLAETTDPFVRAVAIDQYCIFLTNFFSQEEIDELLNEL